MDLLGVIVKEQLKKADFTTFHVSEAIDLLRNDILNEIKRANQGCPPEQLKCCIDEAFSQDFTHAAVLIAECLADCYRTGELTVTEYVGAKYDPVDHHIKEFVVTGADLKILLDELQSVQNPDHWLYQSWFGENTRQEWLEHIQSVYQTLKKHT